MKSISSYFLIVPVFFLLSCAHKSRQLASHKKSVLYIGDSQSVGYLGGFVFDHFKKEGLKKGHMKVYGVSSSSPRHWAALKKTDQGAWLCERASLKDTGRIDGKKYISINSTICAAKRPSRYSAFQYLNRNRPQYVVFQFLGNSMKQGRSRIDRNIGKLLSQLDESQKCIFITSPPFYHTVKTKGGNKERLETEENIKEAVGKRCTVLVGMTKKNLNGFAKNKKNYAGDLMHLSKTGAGRFFRQIESKLP